MPFMHRKIYIFSYITNTSKNNILGFHDKYIYRNFITINVFCKTHSIFKILFYFVF